MRNRVSSEVTLRPTRIASMPYVLAMSRSVLAHSSWTRSDTKLDVQLGRVASLTESWVQGQLA